MSKVDWSKAPEGAEFYWDGDFYLEDTENDLYIWLCDRWVISGVSLYTVRSTALYEERPKEEKSSADLVPDSAEFNFEGVEKSVYAPFDYDQMISKLENKLSQNEHESQAKIAVLENQVEFYKRIVARLTSYEI